MSEQPLAATDVFRACHCLVCGTNDTVAGQYGVVCAKGHEVRWESVKLRQITVQGYENDPVNIFQPLPTEPKVKFREWL